MPITQFTAGTLIVSDTMDANFALCVTTDTITTVTVSHVWTASQTFTGGWTAAAAGTITSASATAFAVGLAGATNPAFVVDASTGSQAAGFKVTGAVAAGTVALAVISSGADANLTLNAKGSGTIGIGSVSTGTVTVTPLLAAAAGFTFVTSVKSTTALATPSALAATQFTSFASTVSGAAIMGFGTTGDVTLLNRAGTSCLYVGPNTTAVTVPGQFVCGFQAIDQAGALFWRNVDNTSTVTISNTGATGVAAMTLSAANGFAVGSSITITSAGAIAGVTTVVTSGTVSSGGFISLAGNSTTWKNAAGDANATISNSGGAGAATMALNAANGFTIGSSLVITSAGAASGFTTLAMTGAFTGATSGTFSTTLTVTGGFGCNTKSAQAAFASGGALNAYSTGVFGLNSDANMSALHALVVAIRAALVADGIMS